MKTALFRTGFLPLVLALFGLFSVAMQYSFAQRTPPSETLLRNVRVLDVVNGRLGASTSVLIAGNRISAISPASEATIIDGHGQTLLPGLIDVHVHLTFGSMLMKELYDPSTMPDKVAAAAARSAGAMLLRGFTAVRDVGGPIFPLKREIDSGKTPGPRVWPSGAVISQTAGHGGRGRCLLRVRPHRRHPVHARRDESRRRGS